MFSDDLDQVMIQIQMKITYRWRWLEDEDDFEDDDDLDDTDKNTCADKLCRENTFLVKTDVNVFAIYIAFRNK